MVMGIKETTEIIKEPKDAREEIAPPDLAEVEEPKQETLRGEKPEETTPKKEEETPQKAEKIPDLDPMAQYKAEADKRVKSYQEKREADTALIRSLQAEITEFKKQARNKDGEKRLNRLMASYDEEGEDTEKRESFAEQVKTHNKRIDELNEKSAEIDETAEFITKITENLPARVISRNGLDDPNPNVRAVNGLKFVDATIDGFLYTENFLLAVEEFFPNGSEVRQKLKDLVEGMADYEGNEKAKKLYLADQMKGLKITPRKAPAVPSGDSGGQDLSKLSGEELLRQAVAEDRKKGK